jgi:hypothetical protein
MTEKTIEGLPNEVLEIIFNFFDINRKFILSSVCWRWKNVIFSTFSRQKSLGIMELDMSFNPKCINGQHSIRKYDTIVNCKSRFPSHVLKCFTGLEVIKIRLYYEPDAEECLSVVLENNSQRIVCISVLCPFNYRYQLPSLRHLRAGLVSLEATESLITTSLMLDSLSCKKMSSHIFHRLPARIKILYLEQEHSNTNSIFKSDAMKSLELLSLRTSDLIDSLEKKTFFRKLKSIRLRGSCTSYFIPSLLHCLSKSPEIREIDLYSYMPGEVSNTDWINFLQYVPKLTLLKLTFQVVDDAFIDILVSRCPLLQTLSITDSRMTDASLLSLSRLCFLEDLRLESWKNNFTESGVMHIIHGQSRTKLQNLAIINRNDVQTLDILKEILLMKEKGSLRWSYFHWQ